MLFKHRFYDGIRRGDVTRTYRAWKSPRVTPGRRYRLAPIGSIEVDDVREVDIGSIRDADARRSGFADRAALVKSLGAAADDAERALYCVTFRFVGEVADPRVALREDTSAAALDEVAAKLAGMDRRSRRGAWTRETLRCIADHPRVAASRLAPRFGLETRVFKTDVRKLKALGLTISHDVGYELSPRGRALLRRLEKLR